MDTEAAHRQHWFDLHPIGKAAHHSGGVLRQPLLNSCGAFVAVGQAQRVAEILAQAAFASAW